MGDEIVFDGGMATFEVVEKVGNDLRCKCTDPGLLLPRAKLSFWRDGKLVEKNNELPTLSTKVKKIYLLLYLLVLIIRLWIYRDNFHALYTCCTSRENMMKLIVWRYKCKNVGYCPMLIRF